MVSILYPNEKSSTTTRVNRSKQYKKGIDTEESRRHREETTIMIRKVKKEERINQRRRLIDSPTDSTAKDLQNALDQKLRALPSIISGLYTSEFSAQLASAMQLRKILSIEHNPPIQQVIDAGVLPRLIEFLGRMDNTAIQFEAAWALTNVASGSSEQTRSIVNLNAVPLFINVLSKSQSNDVREQCIWAIGNIAGDGPFCRDVILRSGGMTGILCLLNNSLNNLRLSIQRQSIWVISNLCRGKPKPSFDCVKEAIPTLAKFLMTSTDTETITDAAWALSYISDGDDKHCIQSVLDSGVCRSVVELLMPISPATTPALRLLGNVVTGTEFETQEVINCNALPSLRQLLITSSKKNHRKEVCWALSNIAAGTLSQVQCLIEADVIPRVVQVLVKDDFEVQKEALYVIANATSSNDNCTSIISYMVAQGIITPLCNLLAVMDVRMLKTSMEALVNVLKFGESCAVEDGSGDNKVATLIEEADGVSKIQSLQYHTNEQIYDRAVYILETYFAAEEEQNHSCNNSAFQFTTTKSNTIFNFNNAP